VRRAAALALAGLALAAAPLARGEPGALAAAETRAAAGAAAQDAVPRGAPFEERLARIRERIQAAVVYPPQARLRQLEGVAQVRFAISAEGAPRDVALAASTGHRVLDRAALAAVTAAAPLPWVYGRLEVPVRFELATRR
jgi:protein TonB